VGEGPALDARGVGKRHAASGAGRPGLPGV